MFKRIILIVFFMPALAFAHGDHSDDRPQQLACESSECSELRAILDDAHHAIEAGDTGSFFKRWQSNFNIKKTALAAFRWYSANQDRPHAANAVANISLMLVSSHTLEVLTGLGLASLGMSDPGSLEQMVYTAVGFTITVPGFDPLCLLLVGSYAKWPQQMDRALTVPRVLVMKSARFVRALAGLPENWIGESLQAHQRANFVKALDRAGDSVKARKDNEHWLFDFADQDGNLAAQLKFKLLKSGRYGLEEIYLSTNAPADILKPFGANIRSLVRELKSENSAARPYIQWAETEAVGRRFYLNASAFPFVNLDHSDCESALQHQ